MPVNLVVPASDDLAPVAGITLGTARAGIRNADRDDLLVARIVSGPGGTSVAGVFTRNRFCAAPVTLCRNHLADGGAIRGMYINAGNANSGTGEAGMRDAQNSCEVLGELLGCAANQILPMSTGVILEPLPMDKLTSAMPLAVSAAQADNWLAAARAIMTTDTQPKAASIRGQAGDEPFVVTGIAKGAGMIRPDMGTMLAIVATDAAVPQALLEQWVREAADQSFNRITVDGDTSTNDSFIVVATGAGPVRIDEQNGAADPVAQSLRDSIFALARTLAQSIVRDGEGATKFIAINVEQAGNADEADAVAYALAHSPLVKTAFFASDPNLGRLLCAIGYADVPSLDISKVQLYLDDVLVASDGGRHPGYAEQDGQRVMSRDEISVTVKLGRGDAGTTIWTCDLSHDYVSINADYRS